MFETDLSPWVVLVVPGRSTADPNTTVGAFAVTPDPRDRAGRADSATALWLAVTAAAADGVSRRRWGRLPAVGLNLQTGDIQEERAPQLKLHREQYEAKSSKRL